MSSATLLLAPEADISQVGKSTKQTKTLGKPSSNKDRATGQELTLQSKITIDMKAVSRSP